MRILFVVLSPITAELGAAQMALNLSSALRAIGAEVVVWTPHPIPSEVRWWRRMAWIRRRAAEYAREDGRFDFVDIPPVAGTRMLAQQCAVVTRSVQPDLQYLWTEIRYAGRVRSISFAVWIASAMTNAYLAALVIAGWFRARHIMCLGTQDFEWMMRWFPWWRGKMSMYVNAISEEERKTLDVIRRNRKKPSGAGTRFLWLGRWATHKGNDLLLDFLRSQLTVRPSDTFTIAGCGPEAQLQTPAEILNTGRVRFVPSYNRKELVDLLETHDVGLFTSRIEGWGLTLQEMLESGMPVYATSAGAVRDLQHFFRGLLRSFPPSMAACEATSKGDMSESSYFERFSWGAIAARYIETIRGVEREGRKKAPHG
jgi:glycosyltransferase involved in cell wall biosynthesis